MRTAKVIRSRLALAAANRSEIALGDTRITLPVFGGLATASLVALSLGAWGWTVLDAQRVSLKLDWPAVAYRSICLFVLDDSGATGVAPWQLDVARLLAPTVTFAALLNWVVSRSVDRIQAWAASRASGHQVLLGPAHRVQTYLELTSRGETIHAFSSGEERLTGAISTPVDYDAGHALDVQAQWIQRTASSRAARVVIATDDDTDNLRMLDELMAASPAEDLHVKVEVLDPVLVTWLSLCISLSPKLSTEIEVICREDALVRATIRSFSSSLPTTDVDRDPDVDPDPPPPAPGPVVAIVGQGRFAGLLADAVLECLRDWHARHAGAAHPVVHSVESERLLDRSETDRVTEHRHDSLMSLVQAAETYDRAIIAYKSPAECLRAGALINQVNPAAKVLVSTKGNRLAGGLTPLGVDTDLSDLDGPFRRVARDRHTKRPSEVPWDTLSDAEQRTLARSVVAVLRAINEIPGYRVIARTAPFDVEPLGPRFLWKLACKIRAEAERTGERDVCVPPHLDPSDLARLPYWLRSAGICIAMVDPEGPEGGES